MATFGRALRRGLPRRPGGDPWPPAGEAPVGAEAVVAAPAASAQSSQTATPDAASPHSATSEPAAPAVQPSHTVTADAASATSATPEQAAAGRSVRRGLPRVPGGEPWPPASVIPTPAVEAPVVERAQQDETPAAQTEVPDAATPPAAARAVTSTHAVRRGLPRTPGGEPWPPADFVAATAEADTPATAEAVAPAAADTIVVDTPTSAAVVDVAASVTDVSVPLPFTRTVWQGASARVLDRERLAGVRIAQPEPERVGPFTKGQWAGATIVGGVVLLILAGMAVAIVRWLLSTDPGQDFLAAYPGEYHLPEGAPVGFPAWLGWQHFFNVFLMVLIIRSGLQVRNEKRPTAFWTPRNRPKGKISLALWFHQSLDILWIVNGVVFVVLLFVSGQWMRIVPTSWEVFPNALSAVLQYISLDWPTENGWVNYNSVQQLAYFATVFLAAPLAIITGVRMSGVWPKNAKTLNRIYPVEWARKVHFPTMIYFCLFIFVHVVLVFATGALRNLNHMYAAQGSTDPGAYADNWAGFWIFFASMIVIVGAWIAARPLVLAPIAKLFGSVSGR